MVVSVRVAVIYLSGILLIVLAVLKIFPYRYLYEY